MRGRAVGVSIAAARLTAGPCALAGFFLPWASGPGVLSASEFTGYKLVGFAGRLGMLDLSPAQGGLLVAVRLLILAVAVAAVWQTILAPAHRWHPLYAISGWYLGVSALFGAGVGLWRSGLTRPPSGLLLWCAGGVLFVAAEIAHRALIRARQS